MMLLKFHNAKLQKNHADFWIQLKDAFVCNTDMLIASNYDIKDALQAIATKRLKS